MAESGDAEFLGGLVVVKHLDFVKPPVLGGGRIRTPNGQIAQISNGADIRFICYLEFSPDEGKAVRGGHVHVGRVEHLYIATGSLSANYLDIESGDSVSTDLFAGDLVTVLPGCAHTYTAGEYAQAIEFSPEPYDPANAHPVAANRYDR